MRTHIEQFNVEYTDYESHKRFQCIVEVIVDLDSIARYMGSRACTSKGGICKDGFVTVKKMGIPKEVP